MNSTYNLMKASANRVKSLALEMVSGTSTGSNDLTYLGALLSNEYDKLSQASIEAVQRSDNEETSVELRESVLKLGNSCLELIKYLGSFPVREKLTPFLTDAKDPSMDSCTNRITTQVNEIVNSLNAVQSRTSLGRTQESYRGCRLLLEANVEALRSFEKTESIPSDKHSSDEIITTLQVMSKESYILFHLLKMMLSNIVSSPEDAIQASLSHLYSSINVLSKFIQIDTLIQLEEVALAMEETFLCLTEFLSVCENSEGKTDDLSLKKSLLLSSKKSVRSIEKFASEVTKRLRDLQTDFPS